MQHGVPLNNERSTAQAAVQHRQCQLPNVEQVPDQRRMENERNQRWLASRQAQREQVRAEYEHMIHAGRPEAGAMGRFLAVIEQQIARVQAQLGSSGA